MHLFILLQTENSLAGLVTRAATRGRGRGLPGYIGPVSIPLQPNSRSSSVESVRIPPSQMQRQVSTENPFRAPTPTGKFEFPPLNGHTAWGRIYQPCDITCIVNQIAYSCSGATCQQCCVTTLISICRRLQPELKTLAHPLVGDTITTCL